METKKSIAKICFFMVIILVLATYTWIIESSLRNENEELRRTVAELEERVAQLENSTQESSDVGGEDSAIVAVEGTLKYDGPIPNDGEGIQEEVVLQVEDLENEQSFKIDWDHMFIPPIIGLGIMLIVLMILWCLSKPETKPKPKQ